MVKNILIKSPDEWATTKQACRDESVVYLFLSSTNIYSCTSLYINALSTVLRKSMFYTLYICVCVKTDQEYACQIGSKFQQIVFIVFIYLCCIYIKLWNSLDSTLKLKPTLKDFKRCLKRSLISNFLVT